jgi:hypothetical protein
VKRTPIAKGLTGTAISQPRSPIDQGSIRVDRGLGKISPRKHHFGRVDSRGNRLMPRCLLSLLPVFLP